MKQQRKSRLSSFFKVFFILFLIILVGSVSAVYLGYLYFSKDLPDFTYITEYRPPLISEVYSSNGQLVAEFASQKRKLIEYEDIPEHVKNAFIAVEDKRFYDHKGFDLISILGALKTNLQYGNIIRGASTITQQVVKNLVLTPEKKYTRKIKEIILAYRMEKNLSKEEILWVYLNHIFLSDNSYGIEAASKNYFGKSAKDINVSEAALLAIIPKAPSTYSPRHHLDKAIYRQQHVALRIMHDEGFLTNEEYEEALNYEIKIIPKRNIKYEVAPYFVETVRQHVENKFGSRAFLNGGFKIFTTLDVDLSLAAHWSLLRGIYNIEGRHGKKRVKKHLTSSNQINKFLKKQQIDTVEKNHTYDAVVTKVAKLIYKNSGNSDKISGKKKTSRLYKVTFRIGDHTAWMKVALSSPLGAAVPELNNPYSKNYAPVNGYPGWNLLPFIPRYGDVFRVMVTGAEDDHFVVKPHFDLQIQGALLSMNTIGYINAMVGGVDFKTSQFNRALQAKRQPGSAFKPIIYSAAIDKGYTQTSIVYDIPVVIDEWIPKNYDESLLNAITLRKALAKSRNLASVRIIMDIDPVYAVRYSKKFGFKSHLNPFPSLALGSSEVTLLEMVKSYNVFATGGFVVEPKMILRIYDRDNKLVEDNTKNKLISDDTRNIAIRNDQRNNIIINIAKGKGKKIKKKQGHILNEKDLKDDEFQTPDQFLNYIRSNTGDATKIAVSGAVAGMKIGKQVIDSQTAYIMTDMLKTVIREGTGRKALKLYHKTHIAGKTGTTNDFTDAWFIGYSPTVITGVWIGRDNHTSIGKNEPGSKAALPIWIDFMDLIISKNKNVYFKVPGGIKFVNTPYGLIPFKSGSTYNEEDIRQLDEEHFESNSGVEIDYLLRRY